MTKLELTDEQLKVVSAGLNELPMKVAAPVFFAIQRQLIAQANSAVEAEAPKKDE